MRSLKSERLSQNLLYEQAVAECGDALDRLVRAYEADVDKRRDLHQEIQMALWRSFETFESRCSLRTWVYRVAHNAAASHVISQRRARLNLVSLEDLADEPDPSNAEHFIDDRLALDKL